MDIPWKLKSRVFSAIDFIGKPSLLYFMQRNLTRRSRVGTVEVSSDWIKHKNKLEKHAACGRVFEFGAGKSLSQNLYLSDVVNEQVVVDVNPMVEISAVEAVRSQLSRVVQLRSSQIIRKIEDLEQYGIRYQAPYDASRTDFDDCSFDACVSNNTLEHIPEESIMAILSELRRTLKDSGVILAKIDYSDHYAHTDSSISLLNFLRFDNETWRKYNHSCHYQNRLRHFDFVRLFAAAGFAVIEQEVHYEEEHIPREVIDAFATADSSWRATSAYFVLGKVD